MAHPDLDQLLNGVLAFAQQMLSQHGEFFPFGSSMNVTGEISMDGTYTGEERPPSQALIDLLRDAYRKKSGSG